MENGDCLDLGIEGTARTRHRADVSRLVKAPGP